MCPLKSNTYLLPLRCIEPAGIRGSFRQLHLEQMQLPAPRPRKQARNQTARRAPRLQHHGYGRLQRRRVEQLLEPGARCKDKVHGAPIGQRVGISKKVTSENPLDGARDVEYNQTE